MRDTILQNRLVAILISLGLGVLIVLSDQALEAAEQRVDDPAGFFSVTIPQGWIVTQVHSQKQSQIKADLSGQGVFLTVTARMTPPKLTWPAWERRLKESLRRTLLRPRFRPLELCQRPALAAEGQSREDPQTIIELAAVLNQGLGFVLSLAYPARRKSEFGPVFKTILTSFTCRPRP